MPLPHDLKNYRERDPFQLFEDNENAGVLFIVLLGAVALIEWIVRVVSR